jgi:hypothetical protein
MSEKFELADFVSGCVAEAEDLLVLASKSLLALEASLRKGEPNPRAGTMETTASMRLEHA